MERQTKKEITREWVEKELRFYNRADIRSTLVLSGALSLFFLPLAALCVWGILSLVEIVWLKMVLAVVVGGVLSAPVWGNLLVLRKSFAERKRLLHKDFEIVTRTVLYKSERTVRRNMVELLHFSDFPPIAVGQTEYQLAEAGDEFYLVRYLGSDVVKLYYSAKRYEYKS